MFSWCWFPLQYSNSRSKMFCKMLQRNFPKFIKKKTCNGVFCVNLLVLTHTFPMHPFSIPWNIRCFQWVEKGCIGKEWVKQSSDSMISQWRHFQVMFKTGSKSAILHEYSEYLPSILNKSYVNSFGAILVSLLTILNMISKLNLCFIFNAEHKIANSIDMPFHRRKIKVEQK